MSYRWDAALYFDCRNERGGTFFRGGSLRYEEKNRRRQTVELNISYIPPEGVRSLTAEALCIWSSG